MSRTALVTGGTRGIGLAISTGLKQAGYTVAANYGGNDAAAKACEAETGVKCFKFDVSDYEAVGAGLSQIEKELGPIDVVVNNAGITWDAPFHRMSLEQWQKVISVDLDSAFNVTRQVWEGMRARGFGRVINISSINGQKGQFGQVNYSAAKAGLIGFTKALAQEGAKKGITVNAVCPGFADTQIADTAIQNIVDKTDRSADEARAALLKGEGTLGRLIRPEEVAQAVMTFCGPHSDAMTGIALPVAGDAV